MKTLSNSLATRLRVQQFLENKWVALVHLTLRDFFRSNGPTVAAGVAYFALFLRLILAPPVTRAKTKEFDCFGSVMMLKSPILYLFQDPQT